VSGRAQGLPFPADELAVRLSRPLVASDPSQLSVRTVELVRDAGSSSIVLALLMDAVGGAQTWAWRLELSPADLELPPDTFVITMRANLEEWWSTRGRATDAPGAGYRPRT
jgi:hypothetical protein